MYWIGENVMECEPGGKRRYTGTYFGSTLGGKLPNLHGILLWSCIPRTIEMDREKFDAFSRGFLHSHCNRHANNAKLEAAVAILTATTTQREHRNSTLLSRVRRRCGERNFKKELKELRSIKVKPKLGSKRNSVAKETLEEFARVLYHG